MIWRNSTQEHNLQWRGSTGLKSNNGNNLYWYGLLNLHCILYYAVLSMQSPFIKRTYPLVPETTPEQQPMSTHAVAAAPVVYWIRRLFLVIVAGNYGLNMTFYRPSPIYALLCVHSYNQKPTWWFYGAGWWESLPLL